MINSHLTSRPPRWDGHGVIAVSFDDDRSAYNALTLLRELDSQRRVGGEEAVVVVRGEDGGRGPRAESRNGRCRHVWSRRHRAPPTGSRGRGRDRIRGGGRAQSEAGSRKELLRARHAHDKAAVKAKIGELKARLHRGESPRHGRRGRDRRSVARRIGGRQTARHSGGRARADPRRWRHMRTCVAQQRLHAG